MFYSLRIIIFWWVFMSGSILSLTQKPVSYNTFSFGGDDTGLGRTGFYGTVVEWDKNAKDDCFKANFVFFIKKAFAFLDSIGIGTCFYGATGFTGELDKCEYYQSGPERNKLAREKIITALGGVADCVGIPITQFNPDHLRDYLKLGDEYFSRGQTTVQGEDVAGRKFVLLRLADRAGRIVIATIHQRYRETCISRLSSGGALWTSNLPSPYESLADVGTDKTVEFIQKVKARQHQEFTLAPKS